MIHSEIGSEAKAERETWALYNFPSPHLDSFHTHLLLQWSNASHFSYTIINDIEQNRGNDEENEDH